MYIDVTTRNDSKDKKYEQKMRNVIWKRKTEEQQKNDRPKQSGPPK